MTNTATDPAPPTAEDFAAVVLERDRYRQVAEAADAVLTENFPGDPHHVARLPDQLRRAFHHHRQTRRILATQRDIAHAAANDSGIPKIVEWALTVLVHRISTDDEPAQGALQSLRQIVADAGHGSVEPSAFEERRRLMGELDQSDRDRRRAETRLAEAEAELAACRAELAARQLQKQEPAATSAVPTPVP